MTLLLWTAPSPGFSASGLVTEVRVANGVPAPGSVSVPIELVSEGTENAAGFSLTFSQTILTNPQVALGSDAAGASLQTNNSQVAQGRLGILLALPSGQRFSAGVRQLLTINFTLAAGTTATSASIGFGDQPIGREVADANANPVPAVFTPATIAIQGYEADVAPRPTGNNNGTVTITDWTQVGRFVAGLDTAAAGSEFQRADCAPRSGLGDGRLTVSDFVQAGRYAAGLDPVAPAGGPSTPAASFSASADPARMASSRGGVEARTLRVAGKSFDRSERLELAVTLDAQGDENALGFSFRFDPLAWRLVSVEPGDDAYQATLLLNDEEAASGRIGVVLALPAGVKLPEGAREVVVINLAPISSQREGALAITFGDYPAPREVVDAEANALPATFTFVKQSLKERRP
ncbi:MAG: hypothetical protein ACREAM_01400 [Blastocatellia bacterium]